MQLKRLYRARATFWAINQSQPFQAFGKPSFCRMFEPLHTDWEKITAAGHSKNIRESVYRLEKIAKDAIKTKIGSHNGLWTTGYGTGPNETSSTITGTHGSV